MKKSVVVDVQILLKKCVEKLCFKESVTCITTNDKGRMYKLENGCVGL